MGKRVFVGNLAFSTTEERLRSEFEKDGRKLSSVSIVQDRETGRSRGFAFVELATDEEAQAMIRDLNGVEIDGRTLNVKEASERASRPAPSGWKGNSSRRDRN